jgi:hypothetical protein
LASSVSASTTWSKTYNQGIRTTYIWVDSIARTPDGGYAIAVDRAIQGSLEDEFVLVKTDAYGKLQWNKTHDWRPGSFVATSDGGFVLGGWGRLEKTDADGNPKWNKTYPAGTTSLVITSDGGFAFAGDSTICMTDSNGNVKWNATYDSIISLVAASDGGVALTCRLGEGFQLLKLDTLGNIEWNKTYVNKDIDEIVYNSVTGVVYANTPDGGYFLIVHSYFYYTYDDVFWVVKTNSKGIIEGKNPFDNFDVTSAIACSDGGYALVGTVNLEHVVFGETDFGVIKLSPSGDKEWEKNYGGLENEYEPRIVESPDGGFVVAGMTQSFGNYKGAILLVKTDSLGNSAIPPDLHWFIPLFSTLSLLVVLAALFVIQRDKQLRRGSPITFFGRVGYYIIALIIVVAFLFMGSLVYENDFWAIIGLNFGLPVYTAPSPGHGSGGVALAFGGITVGLFCWSVLIFLIGEVLNLVLWLRERTLRKQLENKTCEKSP